MSTWMAGDEDIWKATDQCDRDRLNIVLTGDSTKVTQDKPYRVLCPLEGA